MATNRDDETDLDKVIPLGESFRDLRGWIKWVLDMIYRLGGDGETAPFEVRAGHTGGVCACGVRVLPPPRNGEANQVYKPR